MTRHPSKIAQHARPSDEADTSEVGLSATNHPTVEAAVTVALEGPSLADVGREPLVDETTARLGLLHATGRNDCRDSVLATDGGVTA